MNQPLTSSRFDRPSSCQQVGATVVVPTLNRGGYLADCLSDLLQQTHRPLEILVVDQSPATSTEILRVVEAHPDVISYRQVSFRGLLLARNYGWQNARHDAILYVDDDIRCGPEFVATHVRTLCEPRVGIVAGGIDENAPHVPEQLRKTRGFRRWTASAVVSYGDRAEYDVDAAKGCNFSIWRSVAREVGGFDERLNVGAALFEDLELCLRVRSAGYRIRFNGHARLQHLAAAEGGCRVNNTREYVESLAHNHALVHTRHLRWLERPTALARLTWLVAAYARANRDPGVLGAGLRGFRAGVADGRAEPLCLDRASPQAAG